MLRIISFISIVLITSLLSGQIKEIDQQIQQAKQQRSPKNIEALKEVLRIEQTVQRDSILILNAMFEIYRAEHKIEKAKYALLDLIDLQEKLDIKEASKNKIKLIPLYAMTGKLDSAEYLCESLIKIYQTSSDSFGLAHLYEYGANIADSKKDFNKSVLYLKQAREIYFLLNQVDKLAICDFMLGGFYASSKLYSQGYSYLKQALPQLEKSKNYRALAVAYTNIGLAYYELNRENINPLKADTTLSYYDKSKDNYVHIGDKSGEGLCYSNMGMIYNELKDYANSIKYLEKALKLRKKTEYQFLARPYYALANSYFKLGKTDDAKKYLKLAKKELENNEIENANTDRIYFDIANLYQKLGQKNDALFMFQKHIQFTEDVYNKNLLEERSAALAQYETEKKEAENKILLQEKALNAATIRQQRTSLRAIMGIGSLLALVAYMYYRQSRGRQRRNSMLEQKNEQIEALHKDLAHRVKNNLFFVSSLMKMQANRVSNKEAKQAIQEGEARIEAMSLLHRKLNMNQQDTRVSIGEYLKELCANLEHTFPYTDEKPTMYIVTDNLEMDGEDAMRLGLIVNELVTNSFKHAFEGIQYPKIHIDLEQQDSSSFTLRYHDNGVGISSDADTENRDSMGLKLIHTLTKQLDGTLQLVKASGTCFDFNFKLQ